MAERLLRSATTLGGVAVVAGIVSDFFLYDGKSPQPTAAFPRKPSAPFFPPLLTTPCLPVAAVDAGTRAVIFDKLSGLQEKVVSEGTHFRIPYLQVREKGEMEYENDRS